MRVSKVFRAILGFTREVVIMGVELVEHGRPGLRVHVRPKVRRRGRCGELATWFDNGDGARSSALQFVTADGAGWIRDVVAQRAPQATICLDTLHLVSWATDALDEVRREEWNKLRRTGSAKAAKEFKGAQLTISWVVVSRVRLCGRTVESVLKESQTYGKTTGDSGREEDPDRVERDRWRDVDR